MNNSADDNTVAAPLTDDRLLERLQAEGPSWDGIETFAPGPGISRLLLSYDIGELRTAFHECLERTGASGEYQDSGFSSLTLTQRPGDAEPSSNDLSGRYWMRADDRYVEEPFESVVDEANFTKFNPAYEGTYFEHVVADLQSRFPIGRVRVNLKGQYNCNSWHRDPEPRLHVPITTNPGSLFVVNHHVTHLPADGSVYFTDTRAYHTAMNGGLADRVHLIAALAI